MILGTIGSRIVRTQVPWQKFWDTQSETDETICQTVLIHHDDGTTSRYLVSTGHRHYKVNPRVYVQFTEGEGE